MARPTSTKTTWAVEQVKREFRTYRKVRIKLTRRIKLAVIRDVAVLARIHRTTLQRALKK